MPIIVQDKAQSLQAARPPGLAPCEGEAGVQIRSQKDQRHDGCGVSVKTMGGVNVAFGTRLSVAVDGCGWLDIGGVQLLEQAEFPIF